MTRALGDLPFKQEISEVICEPELRSIRIEDDLHFVIVACDGLWDVFSALEAVRFVQRALHDAPSTASVAGRAACVARELAHAAYQKGSDDNITLSLVLFEHWGVDGALTTQADWVESGPDSGSETGEPADE